MTGWRGAPGPYMDIYADQGGGGLNHSMLPNGHTEVIAPGEAGGGGTRQSTSAPTPGYGGCGGPGPGALIGL